MYERTNVTIDVVLQDLKLGSLGNITEIILTDQDGYNIAISDMTSDFYQGDEEKFIQAKQLRAGQYFVDAIHYDSSTGLFQVNVALPIYNGESGGQLLAVLIIGINIEKVLSQNQ